MDERADGRTEEEGRAQRWRDLTGLVLAGLGCFGFIGLLIPEARVVAGACASLFVVVAAAILLVRAPLPRRPPAENVPPPPVVDTLGAALEALSEPAFLVDARLSFLVGNEAARQAFGQIGEGDPIAMRFRAPDVLAAAEEAISFSERREADYVERLPDDRSFGIDMSPLSVAGGRTYLLMRFRDRTAERRIERMRIDFVANASHELRTPLASLIGFVETLQGPARDDKAAQKRFLEIMRQQAGRMSRLIDDLLSLSRIETKRRLSAEDRADLVEVVLAVRAEMQSLAAEVGVELLVETDEDETLLVMGDQDELTRVFANLVENACRYAASGKRVVVGLRPDADGVEAFVQDFGPGIEARHIPRLTERFYRARTDVFPGGTGLGLSIVRNILLRHGTRLLIRSKEGEGSTFSARFRRHAGR